MVFLVLLSTTAYALTLTYINPSDDAVIGQVVLGETNNLSLPDIPMNLEFAESAITVLIPSLNLSQFNPINVSFRDVENENASNSTNELAVSGLRYKVLDAYAFNILNSSGFNKSFNIEFDYSSLLTNISTESKLVLFKAEFNFTTNITDFSTLINLGGDIDQTSNLISTSVNNFSIFILTEDTLVVPSGGGGGGSSSSGSGGPSRGPAPSGGFFVVNCTNNFKDIGEKGIDCGPICGVACTEEGIAVVPEIEEEITPTIPAPTPTPPTPQAPTIIPEALISDVGEPKAIDLVTLALGVLFVVVLIGGLAWFRHEHIKGIKPYPAKSLPLKPMPEAPEEILEHPLLKEHFDVREELQAVAAKKGPKEKIIVAPETMERLVNYIHLEEDKHFDKEKIRLALIDKKWPEQLIDEAFKMKESMQKSINPATIEKLHRYIMKEFGKGYNQAKIHTALIEKDWPEFMVNEAFNQLRALEDDLKEVNLHKVGSNIEEAKEGAKVLLAKGWDKKKLKHALELAGWSQEILSKIVR